MNITIQGVSITLTPEQLQQLNTEIERQKAPTKEIRALEVLAAYSMHRTSCNNQRRRSVKAYAAIIEIIEILNEGWKPNWLDSNQYKYYPTYRRAESSVFVYYGSYNWFFRASVGSFLCFKSPELAEYFGRTFIDLWNDYSPMEL